MSGDPIFFLQISFSLINMSFHFEFHPPGLPGTGQKVFGGGGGWWWPKVSLVFCFGPNLDLDQAEQNAKGSL